MKRWVGILALVLSALLLMGGAMATHGDGSQSSLERTCWPEKEGIRFVCDGQALPTEDSVQSKEEQGMHDPCVPLSPFAPATQGLHVC